MLGGPTQLPRHGARPWSVLTRQDGFGSTMNPKNDPNVNVRRQLSDARRAFDSGQRDLALSTLDEILREGGPLSQQERRRIVDLRRTWANVLDPTFEPPDHFRQ